MAEQKYPILIYDSIGYNGILAKTFFKDLQGIDADPTHICIHSSGGDVFEGMAIYNVIKQHKQKTIMHIEGITAGIASVVALAADEVLMREDAYLMICEPYIVTAGDSDSFRKEADVLNTITPILIDIYEDKRIAHVQTRKEWWQLWLPRKSTAIMKLRAEIRKMMAVETWFTAQEALEVGFIDEIYKKGKP